MESFRSSLRWGIACLCLVLAGIAHSQSTPPLPPQAAAQAAQDGFVQAARQLRERTGRDNALIFYQEASFLAPMPDESQGELLRKVVREGWSNEARSLLPQLQQWNAAVAHVLKGVELNQAEGIGAHSGMETPVPNFLFAMNASRVIIAQGHFYESADQYGPALDRHLVALRMGRDYGSRGNALISCLISVAMQHNALGALSSLVRSGVLDEEQLDRAKREFQSNDSAYAGVAESLVLEHEMSESMMRDFLRRLQSGQPADLRHVQQQFNALGIPPINSREQAIAYLQEYLTTYKSFVDEMAPAIRRESHESNFAELDRRTEQFAEARKNPIIAVGLPQMGEARTREDVMIAKRRLLLTQIALERYRLQHDRYPETLDALRGAFVEELPRDPFSGETFRYQVADGGADYTMYSLGPDKLDNPQAGTYDAANGTISAGVIR